MPAITVTVRSTTSNISGLDYIRVSDSPYNVRPQNTGAVNASGMNQAVSDAIAGRKKIVLPGGDIPMGQINYDSRVHIEGQGATNTKLISTTATPMFNYTGTVLRVPAATLQGFQIDGNNLGTNAFRVNASAYMNYRDLMIRKFTDWGMLLQGNIFVNLYDVNFDSLARGIKNSMLPSVQYSRDGANPIEIGIMQNNLCKLTDCQFQNVSEHAIDWSDSAQLILHSTDFENTGTSGNPDTGAIIYRSSSPNAEGIGLCIYNGWFEVNHGTVIDITAPQGNVRHIIQNTTHMKYSGTATTGIRVAAPPSGVKQVLLLSGTQLGGYNVPIQADGNTFVESLSSFVDAPENNVLTGGATFKKYALEGSTGGGTTTPPTSTAKPAIASFTPTSGPTNTSIDILGTDFIGTTNILFGGVAAQAFDVKSATRITAASSASAVVGPITVVHPNGNAVSTQNFTPTNVQTTYTQEVNTIGEIPYYYNRLSDSGSTQTATRGTEPIILHNGATGGVASAFLGNATTAVRFAANSDYATMALDLSSFYQIWVSMLITIEAQQPANTVLFKHGEQATELGGFALIANYAGTGNTHLLVNNGNGAQSGGNFSDLTVGSHDIAVALDSSALNYLIQDGVDGAFNPTAQEGGFNLLRNSIFQLGGANGSGGGRFRIQDLAIWAGPRNFVAGQGMPMIPELKQHASRATRA